MLKAGKLAAECPEMINTDVKTDFGAKGKKRIWRPEYQRQREKYAIEKRARRKDEGIMLSKVAGRKGSL